MTEEQKRLAANLEAARKDWEPVAYRFELAHGVLNGKPVNWKPWLSFDKPRVPAHLIRNLTPLYADGYLRGNAHED